MYVEQNVEVTAPPVNIGLTTSFIDVVPAPGAGKSLRIHGVAITTALGSQGPCVAEFNYSGADPANFFFPLGTPSFSSTAVEQLSLPPGRFKRLPVNTSLQARVKSLPGGAVYATVFYTIEGQ